MSIKEELELFEEEFTNIGWTGERSMNLFCVTTKSKDEPIFEEEQPMVKKHKNFLIQSHIRLMEEMVDRLEKNRFDIKPIKKGEIASSSQMQMSGWNDKIHYEIEYLQDTIKKYKEELK